MTPEPRAGWQEPARGWQAAQLLAVAALVAAPPALLLYPEAALPLLWQIAVPLLVLVFLVNPVAWRNVCPLATAGMGPPRVPHPGPNGAGPPADTRGTLVSVGTGRPDRVPRIPAPLVGLALLLLLVPLRRAGLEESGLASAGLLAAAGIGALAGRRRPRKAGFCNGVCPLLAVERLYGQAPLLSVPHIRCPTCSVCTVGCVDLSNRASHAWLLGPGRRAGAWLTTPWGAFAAAFPGFVLGFFLVDPAGPALPGMYLALAGWSAISWLCVGVVVRVAGAAWRPSLLVLACLSAGIYLWFALPVGLGAVTELAGMPGAPTLPGGVTAGIRAGVVALVGWKARRGLRR